MNNETKILLDEYKEEFKNYKAYLDANNWFDDVYFNERKGKLESTKLNTEVSIIDTIIKSTNKFKEDVGDDIDKKPIQDFIKLTSEIITRHIERVQRYKRTYPLDEGSVESEVEFHSDLFALITKTKVALSKLNIDENEQSRKSLDLFFGNQKAPLMMRKYLCDNFQVISDKTEKLEIDFSVPHINPATSNEMLINMKSKDIPKWDPNKHFFEQEISTIQFWEEERNKMINGINIGGYKLSPWLYWHTNVYKMAFGSGEEKGVKLSLFRDNEFFFDYMYNKAKVHGTRGVFMYGSRRFAKALDNNEKLYYYDGTIRPIGNCKVGDEIIGGDGRKTTILGVYPQGKLKLYKVKLADGREIKCCDEHLWTVFDNQAGRERVLPLKELLNNYKYIRKYKDRSDNYVYNYYIPLTKTIEYGNTTGPFINPYYFGLWLGDGTSDNTSITTADSEIVSFLEKYSEEMDMKLSNTYKYNYSIVKKEGKENKIIQLLKSRNLIKNKHIPEECFKWDNHDRFELLRGLMDSDGTCGKTGNTNFTNSNIKLFNDALRLCRELGIGVHAYYNKKSNYKNQEGIFSQYHLMSLFTDEKIFNLSRKNERHIKTIDRNNKSRKVRTAIVDITECEPSEATCIKVDNEDKTFLTTDCVVTHNSAGMTSRLLHGMWTIEGAKGTVQGFSKVPDLEAIITYANDAIQNMFPALKIPANSLTLEDGIVLGLKGKKVQDRYDFANLTIVNLEGGTSKKGTQKTAGSTPDMFLLDEAGKGKCIPPWKAAIPSFAGGRNGTWRVVPLISGCVCEGTKVYTHDGDLVNIEDLQMNDGIIGFDSKNNEISKEPITWIQPPSEKPCYRITTMKGYSLECSYEHPILVRHRNKREKIENKWFRKREFIPAENLEIGQQIVINESVDIWGNLKMWEPRLVGWFIGDGHYGQNDIPSISSCDFEINNYISENFKTSDKKKPYYTKDNKLMLNRRLRGTGKNLRELGIFGQTKCNKTLPNNLYKYCKNDLCELLGGIFDTDGHVTIKGNKPTICFTTKCKNLVIEIKHLLNKLGIHPTYNKVISKPNKLVKIETEYYVLSINDKRSIETFYKNINFKIKYKQDILKEAIDILKTYKERIPKELKNQRVDCIKSIEYIGIKPIYNLTAGNTNTYIANQIVTHNTAGEGTLSVDAELMLKDPETYSILPMDWDFLEEFVDPDYVTWNRNSFGFFIPAQMSLAAPDKIVMPFGDFLDKGFDTSKFDKDLLNEIDIHVTNWADGKDFFEGKRNAISNDIVMLAGETNSFPLDPEDCYLTTEINKFPGLESKARKSFVEKHGLDGQKYRLYRDAMGEIHADMTTDPVITDYPYKGGNFDAPVVMLENPLLFDTPPPLGLYTIGFDDVKQEKSDGDSVISACVYKRGYEGGEWADRFVAWFDSRPDRKQEYYRTLYLMIKIFNARILMENADNGFLEWMELNHMDDVHIHFSTGIGLASEENLNLNKNRRFGWAPTPLNIYRLEQKLVMYAKEDNVKIGDVEGLSGIDRINYTMLLEEMYKYKKDKNADRIRTAGLALTLAQYYDKTYQYMKRRKHIVESEGIKKPSNWKNTRGLSNTNKLTKW